MRADGRDLDRKAEAPYKSEGERQIARLLDRVKIGYRYEHPLAVVDRGKVRVWYPDFFLPEYGLIIEYVGMRGDRAYEEGLKHKRRTYAEMSLNVLYVKPESFRGYWPTRVLAEIEEVLEQRLKQFRERMAECVGVRGARGARGRRQAPCSSGRGFRKSASAGSAMRESRRRR